MTTIPAIRTATLLLLATLVQPGHAASAAQDTTRMGSLEVATTMGAVEQVLADATFTHGSPEAYRTARGQIHARLQEMGFQPRWQQVSDFETFTAWHSATRNLTVMCIEGMAPAGWTHRAYAVAGKLTQRDHFPF